jgi:hypothetical protein
VPVSVILGCLAAGVTAEEVTAEYPAVTAAGIRAAAAYGATLAREESVKLEEAQSEGRSVRANSFAWQAEKVI